MHYFLNFRRLSTPFLFLAILFNINPKLSEVRANNKIIPANDKDLELYKNMGISYLCSTSENGTESDFEKSLIVATNLFSTVIENKHGGVIKEGKNKEQKIEPKILANNIMFQLVGGALTYCPVNVPESMGENFINQYKNIEELNKK